MRLLKGHASRQTVYAVAFSPDGASLASCSLDGTLRLWDLHDGTHRTAAKINGYMTRSLAFSPDGRTIVYLSGPQPILQDVAAPGCTSLEYLNAWPYSTRVRFSPDGGLLAVSGWQVAVWELPARKPPVVWAEQNVECSGLAFAPDGRTLAVGQSHWDPRRRRYRHEVVLLDTGLKYVHGRLAATRATGDLAFAPNERTLAAACEEYLTVWHLPTGEPVFQFKSDNRHFQGVAFTPDGRFLAAAHNDKTVRLWETRTWQERAAFDWSIGEVVCIAFSPDGMRAAAGGRSGRIVLWDVDL